MAKKEAGGKSSQQNDFLAPSAPVSVVATNVGTNRPFNNGAAIVSFELPSGSSPATSFTVTATAAGQTTRTETGASSPITVQTLSSATSYTISVTATNNIGTSTASETTTVAITTVPATPAAPTATAQVNSDAVSWTAPANGGSAITIYYWESNDGKSGSTAGGV
jgi:large repetitive protein